MAKNSNPTDKPTSEKAPTDAQNLKPVIYAVSKRLTPSEDEWLRQQKRQAYETFRQSRSRSGEHPMQKQAVEAVCNQLKNESEGSGDE